MVGIALGLLIPVGFSQEASWPQGFSVAFALTELADNFGLGLSVQTPFLFSVVGVRAEAQVYWLNAPNSPELWYPFLVARLGLASFSFMLAEVIRVYGYGGVEIIFPGLWTDYIDNEPFRFGGWGGFGLEIFFVPNGCYYLEIGSTGSPAQTRFEPRFYRNGFQTLVGLRYYF